MNNSTKNLDLFYTSRALQLANARRLAGQPKWDFSHIEGCELTNDACSGGLSWFYKVMGRNISCHQCCICHDFLYSIGGTDKDRKAADRLLRECAVNAGKFEGWPAPLRRGWRRARAWVMYAAVRCFGKSHWNQD